MIYTELLKFEHHRSAHSKEQTADFNERKEAFLEESKEFRSESGSFFTNQSGILLRFEPEKKNDMDLAEGLPSKEWKHKGKSCARTYPEEIRTWRMHLKHLHIPEGVRIIGCDLPGRYSDEKFDGLIIDEDILLPKSLIALGNFTFQASMIYHITLPPTLKKIGCGSFLCCKIDHITVEKEILEHNDSDPDEELLIASPENKLIFGGRSFKESRILEANVIAKKLALFTPGYPELYMKNHPRSNLPCINPSMTELSKAEWIHYLMREAIVEKQLLNNRS